MGNYGKSLLLQHKVSIIFTMNPCDGSFSSYDCAMISPLLCAQHTQGRTPAKSQPGIYTAGSMTTGLLDSVTSFTPKTVGFRKLSFTEAIR